MKRKKQKPIISTELSLFWSIVPIFLTVSLLAIQLLVFNSFDPQVPLMLGIFIVAIVGLLHGKEWKEMEEGMFRIIILSLPATAILLLIGALIGVWMSSGTVPYLLYYGLKFIDPEYFLASGFILCSLMSLALGTSWGTIGTVGVVVVGIGGAMGFPLWLSAATVVSGAFFGDKMSPISDTTNLAPAITGTKVFPHVRNMIPTTVPAMTIGLIVYLIIGFTYEVPDIEQTQTKILLSAIDHNFGLNFIVLLPPLVVVILGIRGFSAIPTMFAGILAGLLIALLYQGNSIGEIFEVIRGGFKLETGDDLANQILNRGGIVSMSDTMSLVFFALTFGGILERLGCLDVILKSVLKKIKRFWQLQMSAISGTFLMIVGTGDSYLPMAFIGRLFSKAYDDFGYSRLNLSRAIEEGGTLMTPLVPWSASGIFVSTSLGLGIASGNLENLLYIPLAIGCWLSPLIGMIFPVFGLFSKKATPEEIKEYRTVGSETGISQPFKSFLQWYNPPVNAFIATPEIAVKNDVMDIEIPLKSILENGDMGFGIYDDQYIIIYDDKPFLIHKDHSITTIKDNLQLHSVNLTHFSRDFDQKLDDCGDRDILEIIPDITPSLNMIYAFEINAAFTEITLDSRSDKPSEFIEVEGKLIGFYYPDFLSNISNNISLFFSIQRRTSQEDWSIAKQRVLIYT
jgi:NhaC family Na+:H+ antiporter